MIKEIKTEKFEGLAVLVPSEYVGSMANMGYLVVMVTNSATHIHEKHFNSPYAIQKQLDRVNKLPEFISLPAIKLPDDEFKILGKSTELTEEQLKLIIPNTFRRRRFGHFQDILEAHGCYSVNPYKSHPERENYMLEKEYLCDLDNYQKAQASTGTWIILQKI